MLRKDEPRSSDAVAPGTGTQALASERKRAPERDAAFLPGSVIGRAHRVPSRRVTRPGPPRLGGVASPRRC
jgi:hypothetical protein